jgi:hypothetical protein
MDSFLEFNTVGLIDTASINPDVAQAVTHGPITTGLYLLVPKLAFSSSISTSDVLECYFFVLASPRVGENSIRRWVAVEDFELKRPGGCVEESHGV